LSIVEASLSIDRSEPWKVAGAGKTWKRGAAVGKGDHRT
jgi:hypothetical protein